MAKNVLIVNFNTQKLTDACIMSVNKFTPGCRIYVFDNSNKEPYVNKFSNVKVFNNTKGKIVNFNKILDQYQDKRKSNGRLNKWGSFKHCYTIEKCITLIPDGFVLLDSDVLLKKDISGLFDKRYICIGEIAPHPHWKIDRVLPQICYINSKMCIDNNVHYFCDDYMHGLRKTEEGDCYDTGSYFCMSIAGFEKREIKCGDYVEHFGKGSWMEKFNEYTLRVHGKEMKDSPDEWLRLHRNLWYTAPVKQKKTIRANNARKAAQIKKQKNNGKHN